MDTAFVRATRSDERLSTPQITADDLRALLEQHGIPVSDWGRGNAKTLKHLMKEIAAGETRLAVEDGRLVRLTGVVDVDIFYKGPDGRILHLREDRQEFRDGRTRRRDQKFSLLEKVMPGEEVIVAAERAVREELGLKGEVNLEYLGSDDPLIESPSYPGLASKYHIDYCRVFISNDQHRPEGYKEEQQDKTTFFVWEESPEPA